MDNFFKFPRTRHLLDAGCNAVTRDDLLMTVKEADNFLNNKEKTENIVVEEKVDGANIGFSITKNYEIKAQNRAHFVNSSTHKQFSLLDNWISEHANDLFKILEPERHILFGEWLYAKHSVHYTNLPDYFLVFDIYDKINDSFLSTKERNEKIAETSLHLINAISASTSFNKKELLKFLDTRSNYYDGYIEGIVIRRETSVGEKSKNKSSSASRSVFMDRAKIVRPDFLQQIEEQWTKQKFTKNILSSHY